VDGANGLSALVSTSILDPGEDCVAGGYVVRSGQDVDADGKLSTEETRSTDYVCNGEPGDGGGGLGSGGAGEALGASSLVSVTTLAPGDDCSAGGLRLEVGQDADGNGSLDESEVTTTRALCNGEPGTAAAKGDPGGRASCHTLMASTFCMSSAPDNIYKERKSVKRSSSKSPPTTLSWQANGNCLTLENIRGLAASLNPGDKELTPVQAWFELAAHYHIGLLLDLDLMESLKREFIGVVKCVHYGATIERQAFESIVGRVLGQYVADQPMTDQPGLAI
jgi:hypothetical protein